MSESAPGLSPTTMRYRQAAEAGDVPGLVATLAPDVVLYSPITERLVFRGREEVGQLLESVFATLSDIHYHAEVGDGSQRTLFDRALVAGRPLEQATYLELNTRDEIAVLTIFIRPLPGLAALTSALAPRITMARHGRFRSLIARVLLAPLAFSTSVGDRLVTWLG